MYIISGIYVMLLVMSVYNGHRGHIKTQLIIELNNFSSCYYSIGLFYFRHPDIKGQEYFIEEFTIGLFFINLNFVFYKENEA